MIKTKKWIFSVASSSFLLAHVAKAEYKTLSLEEVNSFATTLRTTRRFFLLHQALPVKKIVVSLRVVKNALS